MSPDLDAPGWVLIAGEWRWLGAGEPRMRVVHEDYCNYPDCDCVKVRPDHD